MYGWMTEEAANDALVMRFDGDNNAGEWQLMEHFRLQLLQNRLHRYKKF